MMYSAFIVEDNLTKREEIIKALPYPESVECAATTSIAGAYRAIEGRSWDVVILDMTFQISQAGGGEIIKEALAGIELLQYMTRRRSKAPVIVATQHMSFLSSDWPPIASIEELHQVLLKLFPANYRQTVLVDLAEDSWKGQLQDAVKKVLHENGFKTPHH